MERVSPIKRIVSIICSVSLLLSVITSNGVISASADGEKDGFKWQVLTGEAADVRCLSANNKLGDAGFQQVTRDKLSTLEGFNGPEDFTGYLYNARANGGIPRYQETYFLSTEEAHSGTKSLKYVGRTTRTDSQNAELWVGSEGLEPNTDYYFTFWAKGEVDNINDFTIIYDGNTKYESFKIDSKDWKQYTFKINPGNKTKFTLLILDNAENAGKIAYYDDFRTFKVSDAYTYGYVEDFNAPEYETEDTNKFSSAFSADIETDYGFLDGDRKRLEGKSDYSITEEEAHSGNRSLKYTSDTDSWNSVSLPAWNLKKNTDYTVSFWAKGSSTASTCWEIKQWVGNGYGNNGYAVFKDYSGAGFVTPLNDSWTQYRYIINTGDLNSFDFVLLGRKGTMYFDDFSCVETALTTEFDPVISCEAVMGDEAAVRTTSAKNKLGDENVTSTARARISTLEGLTNSSNYTGYLYNLNPAANMPYYQETYSVTDEDAHSGTHSLKYVGRISRSNSKDAELWVTSKWLEKYTDYYFTFWAKGDVDNVNDITFVNGKGEPLKSFKIDSEDWKQYTFKIYSGNQTEVTLLIRDFAESAGKTVYYDDFQVFKVTDAVNSAYFVKKTDEAFSYNPEDNLIKTYPGLENVKNYTDWLYDIGTNDSYKACYRVTNEQAHSGSYSLKYSEISATRKTVSVSVSDLTPNTDYIVSFWTKGSVSVSNSWKFNSTKNGTSAIKDYISSSIPQTSVTSVWTQQIYIINSAGDSDISLVLSGTGGTIYFDDFLFVEKSKTTGKDGPAIIGYDSSLYVDNENNNIFGDLDTTNSTAGFSIGNDSAIGFAGKTGYLEYNNTEAQGSFAKKLSGLQPNTEYTLSYRFNTLTAGASALQIGIVKNEKGDPLLAPEGGAAKLRTVSNNVGWQHSSITFNTKNTSSLYFYINSGGNCGRVIFDEIKLYKTANAVNSKEDNSVVIRPKNDWTAVGCIVPGFTVNGGLNGTKNIIKNADFETLPNGSWNTATFINGAANVTTEEAYSGTHSIKFSANGNKVSSVFWVTLEPNTKYVFQTMCKAYGINQNNDGKLQFGIISADNGMFIPCPNPNHTNYTISGVYKNFSQTQQLSPIGWDGRWHYRGMYFVNETSTAKTVGIEIIAENSTVYFDDMILAKASDMVYSAKYEDSDWATTVVSETPKNTVTSTANNIISNGDFSSSNGFSNIKGYDNFITVDTGSNEMLYDGNGTYAYYIKWINVEPNTDYTFSVYCKSMSAGKMFFGMMDSRNNGYQIIGGDKGSFKPETSGSYKQYSMSFNSKQFSKIGFFICDGGGKAAFSKLRLFKNSNGSAPAKVDNPFVPDTNIGYTFTGNQQLYDGDTVRFAAREKKQFYVTAPWYFTKPYSASVTKSGSTTANNLTFTNGSATFTTSSTVDVDYTYNMFWSKAEYNFKHCVANNGEKLIEIITSGKGKVSPNVNVIRSASWGGMTRLVVADTVKSLTLTVTAENGEAVENANANGNIFDRENGIYDWILDDSVIINTAEIVFTGNKSLFIDAYDINGDNSNDVRDLVRLKRLAIGDPVTAAQNSEPDIDRDKKSAGATDLAMMRKLLTSFSFDNENESAVSNYRTGREVVKSNKIISITNGGYCTEDMLKSSVYYDGAYTANALAYKIKTAKADSKKTTNIVFLGDSITEGASASSESNRYVNKVANWWKENVSSNVKFYNKGIGATTSYLGVHRIDTEIAPLNPDVIFIEYVNDSNLNDERYKNTMDGILRKCLSMESKPAIVLVEMCYKNVTNVQKAHSVSAKAYGVTVISYQDAIKKGRVTGEIQWNDIAADEVHPNDKGHAMLYEMIASYFSKALSNYATATAPGTFSTQPATSNVYANAQFWDRSKVTAVNEGSFTQIAKGDQRGSGVTFKNGWGTTTGGSATFKMNFRNLGIAYFRTSNTGNGEISVTVDGKPVKVTNSKGERTDTANGNYDGDLNYCVADQLYTSSAAAEHTVTVTVTGGGKNFQILGWLVS